MKLLSAKYLTYRSKDRFWRIVLKKSFFADDLKFSGLLARLSRCGVRDHINYSKNDRWRSYRFYRALQRLKSPMRYICEIFGAPRFRVFQHYLSETDSGNEPVVARGWPFTADSSKIKGNLA